MNTKRILIIEDSLTDAHLFEEAIKDCGVDIGVQIVTDWAGARLALQHSDVPLRLVLLDLNLTGVGGCEIITLIKKTEAQVPIVIFSTSSNPHDIDKCYKVGANAYIVKPYDVDQLFETMCATFKWWLDINKIA